MKCKSKINLLRVNKVLLHNKNQSNQKYSKTKLKASVCIKNKLWLRPVLNSFIKTSKIEPTML